MYALTWVDVAMMAMVAVASVLACARVLRKRSAAARSRLPPPPTVRHGVPYLGPYLALVRDPCGFLARCRERYGDAFTIDVLFWKQTYVMGLGGHELFFRAGDSTLNFFHAIDRLTGSSAGKHNQTHEQRLRQASLIIMSLSRHKTEFFRVFSAVAADRMEALADRGEAVDWYKEMYDLIIDLNIRCMIGGARAGSGSGGGSGPGTAGDHGAGDRSGGDRGAMSREQQIMFRDLNCELTTKAFTFTGVNMPWLPWGNPRRCAEIRRRISEIVGPIIRERMDNPDRWYPDYLHSFLHDNRGDKRTVEQVVRSVQVMIFASSISLFKTCFWVSLDIMTRTRVRDAVRDECEDVFSGTGASGEAGGEGGATDEEALNQRVQEGMPYLDKVMRETARFVSGANGAQRTSMCDVRWEEGGCTIPAGHIIRVAPRLTTMDPSVFPDPERFHPERWDAIKAGQRDPAVPKWAWVFFGQGGHRCKGEFYTRLMLHTVWSTMFRGYDIEWVDQGPVQGRMPSKGWHANELLASPTERVMVTVRRRRPH